MLKLLTNIFFGVICMLLSQNVPALKHISPKIISQNKSRNSNHVQGRERERERETGRGFRERERCRER